jgi:hypothetical protein
MTENVCDALTMFLECVMWIPIPPNERGDLIFAAALLSIDDNVNERRIT